ncbi:MAG: hypothetical protein ACOYB4_11930, partial [Methyloceanibacter sp.]
TFHWDAPIIIGAGALLFSLLPPASLPLGAQNSETPSLAELKARLEPSDRRTAVRALHLALSEVGDGMTFVWQRPVRELTGKITPVSAFRDGQGRLCRRVVYWLALGGYERQIEGIGCRENDGSWSLSG